jgi:hypothetical protein
MMLSNGYGKGFCDFGGDENFAVVLLQVIVFRFGVLKPALPSNGHWARRWQVR